MNIDITLVEDNEVMFSTELNSFYFIPEESGDGVLVAQIYYLYPETRVVKLLDFTAVKDKKLHFSGLGDIMRDLIMSSDDSLAPFATFWLQFSYAGINFRKAIKVIPHFGNPQLKAKEYVASHFLNDCNVGLVPYPDNNPLLAPIFNIYLYESVDAIKICNYIDRIGNGLLDNVIEAVRPNNSVTFFYFRYSHNNVRKFSKVWLWDPEKNQAVPKFESMYFMKSWLPEGKAFIFRNSFGLAEYVFIPGVISSSSKKSSSEVLADGALREVDIEIEESFTIKVNAAPDWLVDNMKALLNSNCVFMLEDPCSVANMPFRISEGNVIVTELSGEDSRNPEELSDVSITFKRSDL